jgi:putative transposase
VNRKLTYRLYREAGLAVRRRKRKRIGPFERKSLPKPLVANDSWSMDFMSDGLADGRRLRCLTIVDDCTRECVAIEVDTSIIGSRVMDAWAYQRGVGLSFIRPGKPNDNAYIESFNGKFRDECLNEHWFGSIAHARQVIEDWRIGYHGERTHSSLGDITPEEFAAKIAAEPKRSVNSTADSKSERD